jgi:hypothetical protein
MKLHTLSLLIALLTLSLGTIAFGADVKYGTPTDNKIYAQTLVNKIMAANPQLVAVGMHVAKPGTEDYRIIATTLNVVGKKCDPEDLVVSVGGNTVLMPNLKMSKLGILLPMHDRSGKHIGGFALQFKYHDGDDQAKLFAEALALRDSVAKEIPSVADLFAPAAN